MDLLELKSHLNKNTELLQSVLKKIEGQSNEYLTLDEACEYLKHGRGVIMKYADQIGYFKKEKKVIFKKSDLDNFMKTNTIKRV